MKYQYYCATINHEDLIKSLNVKGEQGFKVIKIEIESRTSSYYQSPNTWLVVMEKVIA